MKDAKGHGSNPRGAHTAGIDAINSAPKRKVVMRDVDDLVPTENIDGYGLNQDRVNLYRQKIRSGESIPPIEVSSFGDVFNGHHRLAAYIAEGRDEIPTVLPNGWLRK